VPDRLFSHDLDPRRAVLARLDARIVKEIPMIMGINKCFNSQKGFGVIQPDDEALRAA
jgi:hypothetical protein